MVVLDFSNRCRVQLCRFWHVPQMGSLLIAGTWLIFLWASPCTQSWALNGPYGGRGSSVWYVGGKKLESSEHRPE